MAIIKLYDPKSKEDEEERAEESYIKGEEFREEKERSGRFYKKILSFFLVRAFIFFGILLCILFSIYTLLKMFFFSLCCVLTFFSSKSMLQSFLKLWSHFKISLVVLAGLLFSAFSLSFGLTIIGSYCMMYFEENQDIFLLQFLKACFKDFRWE